ncbi:MAG: HAD-IIIA family hydrolase, partial [Legionellaceae bacterium]
MKRSFDLVVFDWEGTLGDPLGHVMDELYKQSQAMGLGAFDASLARQHMTLGLEYVIKKLFPRVSLSQAEQLLHVVQRSLVATHQDSILFPGVLRLLRALKAEKIDRAVATNNNQQALARALHHTGLEGFFTVTRAAGQVPLKPCPQMLEEIMGVCAVDPSRTLMIGDSMADIEMAAFAGAHSVGIDFYYQQEEALKRAGAQLVF